MAEIKTLSLDLPVDEKGKAVKPNLSNLTPQALCDEVGDLRKFKKVLEDRLGYLETAFKARIGSEDKFEGEKYLMNRISTSQVRVHADGVRSFSAWCWEHIIPLLQVTDELPKRVNDQEVQDSFIMIIPEHWTHEQALTYIQFVEGLQALFKETSMEQMRFAPRPTEEAKG